MTSAAETMGDVDVRRDDESSRYELRHSGEVIGLIDYRLQDDVAAFVHTEVRRDLQGHGLGAVLVREALDDARAQGWRIQPLCWYVGEFIDRNPDYADLRAG